MNMPAFACDLNVFIPAERDSHVQTTRLLDQTLQAVHPASNGYEFIFHYKPGTITQLAEFIAHERRCCPFLEFTLKVVPACQAVSLTLTGPEGTPDFLHEEFSGAFA